MRAIYRQWYCRAIDWHSYRHSNRQRHMQGLPRHHLHHVLPASLLPADAQGLMTMAVHRRPDPLMTTPMQRAHAMALRLMSWPEFLALLGDPIHDDGITVKQAEPQAD